MHAAGPGQESSRSRPGANDPGNLAHDLFNTLARVRRRLEPEAREDIVRFLLGRLNADGGFGGRAGGSDLYYSLFGIEGVLALGGELPRERVRSYLKAFGDGSSLDFVHLTCLARCLARLRTPGEPARSRTDRLVLARLEEFRSTDGGYSLRRGSADGSAYAAFLGLLAYESLGANMPDVAAMVRSLRKLRCEDSRSFGNEPVAAAGSTPAAAAAAVLCVFAGEPPDPRVGEWLLGQCADDGGFLAAPAAPAPDLLSTATALYALQVLQAPLNAIRAPCLEYVESLWLEGGGFCGHAADPVADCEYTFYGLLALAVLGEADRATTAWPS